MTSRTLDPIMTLQVVKDANSASAKELGATINTSSVSSVCFVSKHTSFLSSNTYRDDENDDSSSSDDESEMLQFQCQSLVEKEKVNDADASAPVRDVAASLSASRRAVLLSCHTNGASYIWDLSKRKIVQEFAPVRGPGLLLRRVDDNNESTQQRLVLYHTRDAKGTVSLHDLETENDRFKTQKIQQFETLSRTFCVAAPCKNNPNLVALPCQDDRTTTIRDWRVSAASSPVAVIDNNSCKKQQQGMLTSLAMSEMETVGRPIVACGMESGNLLFHDLAMLRKKEHKTSPPCSCIALSKDPILSLDMTPSLLPKSSNSNRRRAAADGSVVAIAGLAGDAAELSDLPEAERGTVALIKASVVENIIQARIRQRLVTCQVGHESSLAAQGKPGVSICRFRPDGRIFAVGGWDKRLRIFDRSSSTHASSAAPLAILKGHSESVNAVDWAPDAAKSGLLATGASDGRIYVWRCFSS